MYNNTWEAHIKQQHVDNFFDVLPVVDVGDQQDASVILKTGHKKNNIDLNLKVNK